MKKFFLSICMLTLGLGAMAQEVLTLDSCRALALKNNKEMLIGEQQIKAATYRKRAARTNYLQKISAVGGYVRNQKEMSLLTNKEKELLNNGGTMLQSVMQEKLPIISQVAKNALGALAQTNPGLYQQIMQDPLMQKLIASMGQLANTDIATPINGLGEAITDRLRTDTRNMYAATVSLTQPIYMGGKIIAYNKITNYLEDISKNKHELAAEEVIVNTDQAYWMVVSLNNKKQLAESYLELLKTLDSDVTKMIESGVATKADGLSVKVKVNEAEMNLTKVEDGLNLCRMLLCQICGIDLSMPIVLADEVNTGSIEEFKKNDAVIDMESVYAKRAEIRSLELASKLFKQKVNVTRSEFLPNVVLTGNYVVTNPNTFNGFENKFKGMWNVGIMVRVPLWQWGEGYYKVKAAKSDALISKFKLEDAKEKIELQVNQEKFKLNEAVKKMRMTATNLARANENLRYANVGFKEGVIPTSDLLAAHTAWLKAKSEKLDSEIDYRLANIYLKKALGEMNITHINK